MAAMNPFAQPQATAVAPELMFEPWRRHIPLLRVAIGFAGLCLTALGTIILLETLVLGGMKVVSYSTPQLWSLIIRLGIFFSGLLTLLFAALLPSRTRPVNPGRLVHTGLALAVSNMVFAGAGIALNGPGVWNMLPAYLATL